jgi:hypothetical protein
MPWANGRNAHHVPRGVKREVWERAGGWCELRLSGCQGNVRLEFHHVHGVAINDASSIALACHHCHNLVTQQEAAARVSSRGCADAGRRRATPGWKLQPEPHPGLKRR